MKTDLKEKLLPLILCAAVIVLDQLTKALVVKYIPPYTIAMEFLGDFFRIIHVKNTGVAFSVGGNLPQTLRSIFFGFLPLAVLAGILVMYFISNDFTRLQRWALCGIIGGGFGNLIDRFFRPDGVVDFFDVKFYGLFGLDRWPTFNIADMSVVICGGILVLSIITTSKTNQEGVRK